MNNLYTNIDISAINSTEFYFYNILFENCRQCLYLNKIFLNNVPLFNLFFLNTKKEALIIDDVQELELHSSTFVNCCR